MLSCHNKTLKRSTVFASLPNWKVFIICHTTPTYTILLFFFAMLTGLSVTSLTNSVNTFFRFLGSNAFHNLAYVLWLQKKKISRMYYGRKKFSKQQRANALLWTETRPIWLSRRITSSTSDLSLLCLLSFCSLRHLTWVIYWTEEQSMQFQYLSNLTCSQLDWTEEQTMRFQ